MVVGRVDGAVLDDAGLHALLLAATKNRLEQNLYLSSQVAHACNYKHDPERELPE